MSKDHKFNFMIWVIHILYNKKGMNIFYYNLRSKINSSYIQSIFRFMPR